MPRDWPERIIDGGIRAQAGSSWIGMYFCAFNTTTFPKATQAPVDTVRLATRSCIELLSVARGLAAMEATCRLQCLVSKSRGRVS